MTKNNNSALRGGLAPLITRRAALAFGLGSAAAGVLPSARAPAAGRPVVALAHGADWYARPEAHAQPIAPSPELTPYEGA
jgi:hypothetical protein